MEYNITPLAEGDIAFTGVQKGGLIPYTWAYNVASFEWGTNMVPIEWKSSNIIDVLPTGYLENVKTILEKMTRDKYDSLDDIKTILKTEGSPIQFEYDLYFAKMAECLNDAVIMRNLKMIVGNDKVTIWASYTSELYKPKNEHIDGGVWYSVKKHEKDDDTDEIPTIEEDDSISNPDGWVINIPDDDGPSL